MSYKACFLTVFFGCLLLLLMPQGAFSKFWDFPALPPPHEYGNILMNRTSEKSGVKPVIFSHWVHRQKHTCRVCHFELDFTTKMNTTEITEADNKQGKFCGASGCHDGKTVFGHDEQNCGKCHGNSKDPLREKFSELPKFPSTRYGDGIDWVGALAKGMIKPDTFLTVKPSDDINFKKVLLLESEWHNIPPAYFPHNVHIEWLDCNNCHPDIFNIKKKTTKHFTMMKILNGEFCGVCHLRVAFPMDDCQRCHPDVKE